MGTQNSVRFLGIVLVSMAVCACSLGGQTGDGGETRAEIECSWESEDVALEDAVESNPYMVPAVEELFGDTGERSLEFILVGPPELWTERGLEPSEDRATPATLSYRATGEATVFYTDDEACEDYAIIPVQATLTLPEFASTLTTTGKAEVSKNSPQFFTRAFEFETLGRCLLIRSRDDPGIPFDGLICDRRFIYGSSQCLDTEEWLTPKTEPTSGLKLNEVVQHVVDSFPTDFHCSNSARSLPLGTVRKITIPERYCGYEDEVPAIVELIDAEGTVSMAAAHARWEPDEQCYLQDCADYQPCFMMTDAPEEEDTRPRCPKARVSVEVSNDSSMFLTFSVQVEKDESLLVGIDYASYVADELSCWGQRVVE